MSSVPSFPEENNHKSKRNYAKRLNPKTTFIYQLIDPETDLTRYIGKANDPQERSYQHLRSMYRGKTIKNSWLQSLDKKGLFPELRIIEEVPYPQWEEKEKYWIVYYLGIGAPLTNGTEGGIGTPGMKEEVKLKLTLTNKDKKHSPEVRAKIAEGNKGKVVSEQTRQKIREANLGRKLTPEHCKAISQSHKGQKVSEKRRKEMSEALKGKPVPPEILEKKRKTIEERKASGLYANRTYHTQSKEHIAKMKAGVQEAYRKKEEEKNKLRNEYGELPSEAEAFRLFYALPQKRKLTTLFKMYPNKWISLYWLRNVSSEHH